MSDGDVAALLENFDPLRAGLAAISHDLNAAGDHTPLHPFIERTEAAVLEIDRLCRYLNGLNLAFANMADKAAFNSVIAANRAWAARLRRAIAQWQE